MAYPGQVMSQDKYSYRPEAFGWLIGNSLHYFILKQMCMYHESEKNLG